MPVAIMIGHNHLPKKQSLSAAWRRQVNCGLFVSEILCPSPRLVLYVMVTPVFNAVLEDQLKFLLKSRMYRRALLAWVHLSWHRTGLLQVSAQTVPVVI